MCICIVFCSATETKKKLKTPEKNAKAERLIANASRSPFLCLFRALYIFSFFSDAVFTILRGVCNMYNTINTFAKHILFIYSLFVYLLCVCVCLGRHFHTYRQSAYIRGAWGAVQWMLHHIKCTYTSKPRADRIAAVEPGLICVSIVSVCWHSTVTVQLFRYKKRISKCICE